MSQNKNNKQMKVNWYSASKDLSARVLEFGDAKLWGIIHRSQAKAKIAKIEASIGHLEELKGSILDEGDNLENMRKDYESQIDAVNAELEQLLEKDAKFVYTANDEKFYKTYKKASTDKEVKDAIVEWIACYGIDTADTKDVAMLYDAIRGAKKLGAGAIVRSNGTKFTNDKRSKGDVMGIFYGKMCELLVAAGTIKLVQLPEDVRAMYTKKKNK